MNLNLNQKFNWIHSMHYIHLHYTHNIQYISRMWIDSELENLLEYITCIENSRICILFKYMYIFTTYYMYIGGLQRISVYLIVEVYLKTYTLEWTDYMLATLIPNAMPCVLQKGPGEGVIYLQITEMLSFCWGKGVPQAT